MGSKAIEDLREVLDGMGSDPKFNALKAEVGAALLTTATLAQLVKQVERVADALETANSKTGDAHICDHGFVGSTCGLCLRLRDGR